MASVTRYLPDRSLPPYSYVPGKFPHPVSDRRGHMFHEHAAGEGISAGASSTDQWLWGFDLFNHGFYWEAHEAWEQAWLAAGRVGPRADLIKGLIKLAAAGVKAREGKAEGVRRHAARALELLSQARSDSDKEELPVANDAIDAWIVFAEHAAKHASELLNASQTPVVIVFRDELQVNA